MSGPVVPHFAFPLVFSGGAPLLVEQDSHEEVLQCVQVLLSTSLGERIELPAYGVEDQTFQATTPMERYRSEIQRWEPRALTTMAAEWTAPLDLTVRVGVDNIEKGL